MQALYLAGRKTEAEAAVPDELVDKLALVGPRQHIAGQLEAWRRSGVTTLACRTEQPEALRTMAELVS